MSNIIKWVSRTDGKEKESEKSVLENMAKTTSTSDLLKSLLNEDNIDIRNIGYFELIGRLGEDKFNSQFANHELEGSFELIKSAFDNEEIEPEVFLDYQRKYAELLKASDPTHGGKLEKVAIMDKNGKSEIKWMSKEEAVPGEKPPTTEKTKHTYETLHGFAKDTPATELKRIINESHDEKLRKAAHRELDRRANKEAVPKDKPGEKKKPVAKKKVEPKPEPKKESSKLDEKKVENIPNTKVTLYHGSDTKFDEFDDSKISTGEGSDLFGAGFYLTDSKDVADFYAHNQAKRQHITGYNFKGIFGTRQAEFAKDADEKAANNKHINEFKVDGKIIDCQNFKVDDKLKQVMIDSLIKHRYRKIPDYATDEVERKLEYVRKNTDDIYNYRGELIYMLTQIADQDVKEDVMNSLKDRGYQGIKYAADKEYEGADDSNNYMIFDKKAIGKPDTK